MATQYQEPGQLPEGIVVAHTLYGRPDESITHAHTATAAAGVELIPVLDDGIPYYLDRPAVEERATPDLAPEPEPGVSESETPDDDPFYDEDDDEDEDVEPERPAERAKRCMAKNDTCMGWAMTGGTLCAAHAGVWKPHRLRQEPFEPPETL